MAADSLTGLACRTEKEDVTIFMGTLSSTYYVRLIGHTGLSFANLVQIGERLEDDLKIEK